MPVSVSRTGKRIEAWILALRETVTSNPGRQSWVLSNSRGSVRLRVRIGTARPGVTLPLDWCKANVAEIVRICDQIAIQLANGKSLEVATKIATTTITTAAVPGGETHAGIAGDWEKATETFKTQKLHHGNSIKTKTWEEKYEPVLKTALELMKGNNPPGSAAELIDFCIRDWEPGSRSRQIRAQNLTQWLRHCVEREGFPVHWTPPNSLSSHIGRKPADLKSREPAAFTDTEILNLLDSFPEDAAGIRWKVAIQLMALLGLRPIELQHLEIRIDKIEEKRYWWCKYQKRSGGGTTPPRRLYELPLTNVENQRISWHLLERWQAGLIELPSLTSGTSAGDCIATYLNRRPGWRSLKAMAAARGESASPYSFRHSYSLRGHRAGIDSGSLADAMGHTLECHLREYRWASAASTAEAFRKAAREEVPINKVAR